MSQICKDINDIVREIADEILTIAREDGNESPAELCRMVNILFIGLDRITDITVDKE